ncbi:hypothetical protein B0T19DRAFT_451530 [Cercophora scortea]|uniref:Fe2OG dioxygenase domain-containing protein n=1 Tax=Cercophora scortea TaxID=314031 RepID=A0AAE0M5L5_9PEZI|nr:hypothetical protein B0T19DRAFT_451530 [Cercophora scortea]
MSTTTTTTAPPRTTQLRLSSGNGPVTRTVLTTPVREAKPEEVPIIDISPIFSPSLAARQAVADQIRAAATNNGFFYIVNHQIPTTTTAAAHDAALAFFRQPAAHKEPVSITHSTYQYGWKPPQTQRVNPFESIDHRESFSWRYDPVYDPSVSSPSSIPAHIRQHIRHDANGFPFSAVPPPFKAAVIPCWQAVLSLGRALLHSFALALGLDETTLDAKFTNPDLGMALNYYAPLPSSSATAEDDESLVSIGSHTDFQLFTLLWQDKVGGLQVLSREGQWLHAAPMKGAFVVNFGDYMQRITNDRFASTVHRVRNVSGEERLSMAFFFGFNLDETCDVLDSCVGEGESKRYEPVACHEWTERRVRAMHDVRGRMGGEGKSIHPRAIGSFCVPSTLYLVVTS